MLLGWRRRKKRDPKKAVVEALGNARSALISVKRGIALLESRGDAPEAMLKSLYIMENVLEAVIIRLETILVAGVEGGQLIAEPIRLVREASKRLREMPPEIYGYLGEIESQLMTIASAWDVEVNSYGDSSVDKRVERILREAEAAAAERVQRLKGDSVNA